MRLLSRIGNPVTGPKGGWAHRSNTRAFYWFSRPYNLLELYDEAGALTQLYVHVASPAQLLDGELHYTDHELDVVRKWGEAPFTTDADELEQALIGHIAAVELRDACHRAAAEATGLLGSWSPHGPFAPATQRDPSGEPKIALGSLSARPKDVASTTRRDNRGDLRAARCFFPSPKNGQAPRAIGRQSYTR